METSLLEEAIQIATEAHRGQKGRTGHPYILHPMRVMCRMTTEKEMITAILHDVVEDSSWTLDDLKQRGFPADILEAVDCLTKREGEAYDSLIARAGRNPLAKRVKLADLEDNMDLRHHGPAGEKDLARFNRYRQAWSELNGEAV
jgi:(p)ppGpp synthase/HD superfamily hydrolase